jgi:hypothetical protein
MMNKDTCLVIDVWEGSLEIDEALLKENGVYGIGIRLNDMSGGHHKDKTFDSQWYQARGMVRFPYFVFNPWVDGRANYNWLLANMPAGATSVAIDVEVIYNAVPPAKYGAELSAFLSLANKKWKTIIYTAEWFLNKVTPWAKQDYWWAQYPDPAFYLYGTRSWDELKKRLDNPNLQKPMNAAKIPGNLKMWQFSGDYLILPGTIRDIDVNIFYGTTTELAQYFGQEVTTVEPTITDAEKLKRLWDAHVELQYNKDTN